GTQHPWLYCSPPRRRFRSLVPCASTHRCAVIGPVSSVSSGTVQLKTDARERFLNAAKPEFDGGVVASRPAPARYSGFHFVRANGHSASSRTAATVVRSSRTSNRTLCDGRLSLPASTLRKNASCSLRAGSE